MMRRNRRQELLMGAAITVLLLIFAGLASFCVATHGLGFLDSQMGQTCITAGSFLAIIVFSDIPAKIRSSEFLTLQTIVLSLMLGIIGFGPQYLGFLPQTRSYEHWSALFMLAAILLFAAFSVVGLIYRYVTARNTDDS